MRSPVIVVTLLLALLCATAAHAYMGTPLARLATPNLLAELSKFRVAEDQVDVVIELKDQVDVMRIKKETENRISSLFAHKPTTSELSDFVARSVVHELRLNAELTQGKLLQYLSTKNTAGVKSLWIVNAVSVKKVTMAMLHDLVERFGQDIKRIELNAIFTLPVMDDEEEVESSGIPYASDKVESNLKFMQATDMWELGFEGEGITLSIVDTGVDAIAHPALKEQYRGKNGDHDYNWWDPYRKSPEPRDSDRHGTHCTGSMVGDDRTSSTRHVYGVAPKANYIGCMGLDRGSGTLEALLSCWEFTMAPTTVSGENPDPSKRAHVTSNSWGANGYSSAFDVFRTAADSLRSVGIFVALAAGNSGSRCSSMGSPGVFENVFAVCAVHKTKGSIASFSSRGPVPAVLGTYNKPDACAPGQSIVSSVPGGKYSSMSGTSMATPHVAAAVALLWEAVPELARDVAATEQLLKQSAEPKKSTKCKSPQSVPNYEYGSGNVMILDAYKAAKGMKL